MNEANNVSVSTHLASCNSSENGNETTAMMHKDMSTAKMVMWAILEAQQIKEFELKLAPISFLQQIGEVVDVRVLGLSSCNFFNYCCWCNVTIHYHPLQSMMDVMLFIELLTMNQIRSIAKSGPLIQTTNQICMANFQSRKLKIFSTMLPTVTVNSTRC